MTAHVACPCGWSTDVDLVDRARVSMTQILADHARAHTDKGEPYRLPTVTVVHA